MDLFFQQVIFRQDIEEFVIEPEYIVAQRRIVCLELLIKRIGKLELVNLARLCFGDIGNDLLQRFDPGPEKPLLFIERNIKVYDSGNEQQNNCDQQNNHGCGD